MTTFIEFHALRSFPPSNLNRDDLGSPKTAIFGGARRLRISSQCLKRTWRTSEHFRGAFAEEQLGVRTDRLPEQVLKALGPGFDDLARQGLIALLASIGKKQQPDKNSEDSQENAETAENTDSNETAARTVHLLFLSRQEVEAVADFSKLKSEALSKLLKKNNKVDGKGVTKLRDQLKKHLIEHTSKNAVDVGLFGRFVTSDEFDTVDGALQVAHGLGTQKVELEYDYFTAVDDLSNETGAGHLGESEFASSVLYLYACCDLNQLEKNLGARSPRGRKTDQEGIELARQSLPALVKALAQATPTGKKTGTAPHTPAEYIEVVIRRGTPLSFANAFTKPVGNREAQGDVMAASIKRLAAHRDTIEHAYGRDEDALHRYVLCLRDVEGAAPKGCSVDTIAALSERLTKALKVLPPQVAK